MAPDHVPQPASWAAARYLLPLGAFLALAILLGVGLGLNPREVPSPLVGKPAPHFELPQLHRPDQNFSEQDMRGKVWMLNVWASWCVACRQEHPFLNELARNKTVSIIGLNYKDKRDDALGWLGSLGNPYELSLSDTDGRLGIDLGVYGVPETFVIDKQGVIRYKQIGPITPEAWEKELLPRIREIS